ncbi:TPA: fimbrial protein [Providencia stuartii]|nr:fimbrial protein [Providencia stuartii]
MNNIKKIICLGIIYGMTFPILADNSANVTLKGTLLLNPPCELTSTSGNNTIEVEFGDIVIRKMSTSREGRAYKQTLPFKLVCDAPDGTGVHIYVNSPSGAIFDQGLVSTSNENVGILFINNNGVMTRLGNPAGMTVDKQSVIEVVPILNNSLGIKVDTGEFSATATLTVVYS